MTSPLLPRVILGIAAATFLFFGVAYVVDPESMVAVVGLRAASSTARADVRSVYGGLELAIAALLFACAWTSVRVRDGLFAALVLFAGLGVTRLVSGLFDGELTLTTLRVTAGELFAALGCAFGLFLSRRASVRRREPSPPAS